MPTTNATIGDGTVFAHPSLSHMTYDSLPDAGIHQYGVTGLEMLNKTFILSMQSTAYALRGVSDDVNNLIFFYLPQPYGQAGRTILNVQLDGAPYIAHGKTFTLRQTGTVT